MIYLDNAATTKINQEVINSIKKMYDMYFMNADSPYYEANKINELQEQARTLLASLLSVNSNELIYTSCGSESNNMAIKGIAYKYLNEKKHIITTLIEHSSVYECMKHLEKLGFEVTYLKPNNYGQIDNNDIIDAIKDNTILISVMKINSEIGSINKLEEIYDDIKKKNNDIIVHMDCVQAFGKYDLNLNKCDLASFSAHKINGVKGSGLLYKKSNITIMPLINGGQQEYHLRAGTSNYYYNIAFTKTLRLYLEKRKALEEKNNFFRERYHFLYSLLNEDNRIYINSSLYDNSYYIINFSIPNYKPEVILNALENKEIYISTKSACSSKVRRSRVIDSLNIDDSLKDTAFRVSMSLDTTYDELKEFNSELISILDNIEKKK